MLVAVNKALTNQLVASGGQETQIIDGRHTGLTQVSCSLFKTQR